MTTRSPSERIIPWPHFKSSEKKRYFCDSRKARRSIIINGEAWKEFTDEQQTALLDHELTHLMPKKNKDGDLVTDDLGRPVFKIKPHDFELSWFSEVARRHGKAAIEVKSIVNFIAGEDGQFVMPFAGKALLEPAIT